ncbi:hypothetical protein GEV33_002990 [Tenebrio molitor]|uniref:Uncharacterized protein n=1 Tax=Tenebrio molitor TaxID=7067 RepID=A0A8J6LNX7_TENMO|nr:hypothetical protein GEV33_002990 [Tenebrio molitor]
MHARSQPNMRQLGSAGHLENMKAYKSMDKEITVNNISKMMVSQSAPHTPVSAPNHTEGPVFKSVPRLLSEPTVGGRSKSSSPATKTSKLERNSPHMLDKRADSEMSDSFKVRSLGPSVPVHSPKHTARKDMKFFLKSPLIKRDTKIQLERATSKEKPERINSLDGTHRGETIKDRRECGDSGRGLFVFGLWSGRSDRCGTVKGAETARKGRGDVQGPKRLRLEEESRKSKHRRRGADLRIPDGRFVKNQTPECGVKFHARISSSTVGPRKSPRNVQVSRDVDRPVTIKARVIEKFFSFREASASFQAERFFCSGWLSVCW